MKLGRRYSIVLPIVASFLAILSAVAVITYKVNIRFLEKAQTERIRDNVYVISAIIRTIVENQVKGLEALSKTLQENKELAEGMAYFAASGYVNPLEDAISRLFPSLNIDILLPIDMQGQVIDLNAGSQAGIYAVLDIDTALKGHMVVTTADGPEGWALRALIPLFWPFGLDQYGVLVAGIRIDDAFAGRIAAESNAQISFAHPGGNTLASSADESYQNQINWEPAVRSIIENQSIFFHERQNYISTAYVPIEMANETLCLIVQQDTSKSYVLLSKERKRLWYTLIGIIIVVLIGAFWLFFFIVRPLRRLEARTQSMIEEFSGEFNESLQQGNEIHRLVKSFGFMHLTLLDYTRQLKDAKTQAEAASLSKGQFLANMSHEIRTPMNAILGFTDLLDGTTVEPQNKKYLEAIKSSGKSLMTLIDDILDLSKIEAGKLEIHQGPVNLANLFAEIEKIFEPRLVNKNIEFITTIADDIPSVIMIDEARLRQILFNLIGNAIKFTPRGSIGLSASIENVHSDSKMGLVIKVTDTGIGIDPLAQKQIFEAFEQNARQNGKQYGGTGLGLAISKNLVEMLGGHITVSSEPGQGSEFKIRLYQLDLNPSSINQTREPELHINEIVLNQATLVVADDVETTRTLIREIFKDTAVQVIEAKNGKQAIQASLAVQPHVILMDLKMPKLDGYEAFTQIRRNPGTSHIPIIAMTAAGMHDDIEKINANGFDDYLIKPFDIPSLMRTLVRFIGQKEKPGIVSSLHATTVCDTPQEIPGEELTKLPKVIALLENEFYTRWETVRSKQRVPDIENFARQLRTLGEEHMVQLLTAFGTELLTHIKGFDIDRINMSLKDYPNLIASIKTKLNKTG